jgi:peptidoglycan-associated lipoprotein
MDKRIGVLGVLALIALMAGCSSGAPVAGSERDPAGLFVEGENGTSTNPLGDNGRIALTEQERLAEERRRLIMQDIVVYFEFDQATVLPEFNEMLSAHAEYLVGTPGASVRLEGHADETGSREYNIGLGERRAQAVRRILMLQGASASQLTTVSYGEERPAALGSDEESYSLNRRVELVYGQ